MAFWVIYELDVLISKNKTQSVSTLRQTSKTNRYHVPKQQSCLFFVAMPKRWWYSIKSFLKLYAGVLHWKASNTAAQSWRNCQFLWTWKANTWFSYIWGKSTELQFVYGPNSRAGRLCISETKTRPSYKLFNSQTQGEMWKKIQTKTF